MSGARKERVISGLSAAEVEAGRRICKELLRDGWKFKYSISKTYGKIYVEGTAEFVRHLRSDIKKQA